MSSTGLKVLSEKGDIAKEVSKANIEFYNRIAEVYEEIDGRRNVSLLSWIGRTMEGLGKTAPANNRLLDLGCGRGVVLTQAAPHFRHVYGMDISSEILKGAKCSSNSLICADGAGIPLKSGSVDVVVCFAVLHHIYDHGSLFREIHRVLRDNGILYTDHDMDSAFMERFKLLMRVYRFIFSASRRYRRAGKGITDELYRMTEIHSEGLDSSRILEGLKDAGFGKIENSYHWYGLNGITNRLFGHRQYSRGSAPLLTVLARK
ncbi:MAG: methyltransferase domain-containing protein [Deltaproteobacteria bacterium]|nr:methyltransferase domain-containing protein [Deltaproteobacteria bacterium]